MSLLASKNNDLPGTGMMPKRKKIGSVFEAPIFRTYWLISKNQQSFLDLYNFSLYAPFHVIEGFLRAFTFPEDSQDWRSHNFCVYVALRELSRVNTVKITDMLFITPVFSQLSDVLFCSIFLMEAGYYKFLLGTQSTSDSKANLPWTSTKWDRFLIQLSLCSISCT